MLSLYKNKKGDMPIVLLVMLVLTVVLAALFSFATDSGTTSFQISNARAVDINYAELNFVEFYIKDAGKKAAVKSYKDLIESGVYTGKPVYNSNGEVEFNNLGLDLNEKLEEKFKENFKSEIASYDFEKSYLIDLKKIVAEDKFSVNYNEDIFEISINGLKFDNLFEQIEVVYVPEILMEFDYGKIGVDSFEEVYTGKEKCKSGLSVEDIKICIGNEVKDFNVDVIEKTDFNGEKYTFVSLNSKNEFLIENKFENIRFGFALV